MVTVSEEEKRFTISVSVHDGDEECADTRPAEIKAVMQRDEDENLGIVEMTVRAGEEGDLPARTVRNIDFEMLARALGGTESESTRTSIPATAGRASRQLASGGGKSRVTRPYRRMPAKEDVKARFLETRSVGKLARHYDVPRYTAQAWVDRLRRNGYLD
ncbi:hypothetical protein FHX37_3728 [Haloactinospora alba]|uniref:Helix-turn-helix protein n=1 Tax=Haloactinospora alba TaxID=405555 RepID=A0A543N996_9ACTN|nr:hypothetical protein [Haloactinospora alba]TQN28391.1 hypothetical protein FHX37_3728 [Haloactinospora alba]